MEGWAGTQAEPAAYGADPTHGGHPHPMLRTDAAKPSSETPGAEATDQVPWIDRRRASSYAPPTPPRSTKASRGQVIGSFGSVMRPGPYRCGLIGRLRPGSPLGSGGDPAGGGLCVAHAERRDADAV